MIRLAAKVSRTLRCGNNKDLSFSPPMRHLSTKSNNLELNPVALQMINYATSLARGQKTDDSYGQGLLILEQCESTQPDDNSKALVELARSTLLFERGSHEAAIERLQKIQDLSLSSVPVKVAASEAIVGIHLEHYQEDSASVAADIAIQLLDTIRLEISNDSGFVGLEARIKALKGLIELIRGSLDTAESFFEGFQKDDIVTGSAALSYGEYFHGKRNFSTAKELYQSVIKRMSEIEDFNDPENLGASNMIPSEVATAATCALGQVEAHMGNFGDAEETLTLALKKVEERLGPNHPKVGVILTCIALMYRLKAAAERSSSLLIQEGLFRRAIELLKSPTMEIAGASANVNRKDIIALARGGYAETLCVQQSRKAEGERLKHWAESAWGNRRMSLVEALEVSESSSKVPVIDTRICRVV